MQPFEFVVAIMIADLASVPMGDTGIPITNGIIPILVLLLIQLIMSIVSIKSIWGRRLICGMPTILIYKGRIDEKQMKKEKFTINELQERLRQNNIFDIGNVEYAILETSGQLTVMQKPEKRNTTPKDFNIMPQAEGIPYDLVVDGKVINKNLQKVGKDYNWLLTQAKKFKIKPEDALVITYSENGQIFCQKKEEIR